MACLDDAAESRACGGRMSTKLTLACHRAEGDEPTWHLYEEPFESGVVYLELRGVDLELETRADPAHGGVNVVLCLPIKTASQLGLQSIVDPERWQRASDPNKDERLWHGLEEFDRLRDSSARGVDSLNSEVGES
jgi:hypothetical protein